MLQKKIYSMYIVVVSACLISVVFAISVSARNTDDVCSLPVDSGVCSALFLAWYYDPQEEQCREFVYRGCGGNKNRFATEEECYKNCKERLINLHPPNKVNVAFATRDRIFIYWYPPHNFKIHEVIEEPGYNIAETTAAPVTTKEDSITHSVSQMIPTSSSDNGLTTKPQQNVTQSTNTSKTEAEKVNQNNTAVDIDKNTTVSTSNSSADMESTKTPEINITPSLNIDKNSSINSDNTTDAVTKAVSEQIKTVKPNLTITTQKPPENETANSTVDSLNVDNKTSVYQLKDFVGKETVPFHFAVLTGYVVSYRKDENDVWKNETLPTNSTEYTIANLDANTELTVRVGAVYLTNTTMFAPNVIGRTRPDKTVGKCLCHPLGTVGGTSPCHFSPIQFLGCRCKPGYSGLFCELCHSGYYRIADTMPCHKCPCSRTASTGSCHFIEGYLHCLKCRKGYAGTLCHHCDNGYYRNHHYVPSQCVPCQGCHNVKPGPICDPLTGRCVNCLYNTTGHRCDKCLPGFKGDPVNNINCTLIETNVSGFKAPSPGIIAAVCVITILVISAIVGCIIYRRMKNYPSHRPFWTIELKEGHEGVNFSSVPDDDHEHYHDDVRFNDKETKSKSQPYARLQEDF